MMGCLKGQLNIRHLFQPLSKFLQWKRFSYQRVSTSNNHKSTLSFSLNLTEWPGHWNNFSMLFCVLCHSYWGPEPFQKTWIEVLNLTVHLQQPSHSIRLDPTDSRCIQWFWVCCWESSLFSGKIVWNDICFHFRVVLHTFILMVWRHSALRLRALVCACPSSGSSGQN